MRGCPMGINGQKSLSKCYLLYFLLFKLVTMLGYQPAWYQGCAFVCLKTIERCLLKQILLVLWLWFTAAFPEVRATLAGDAQWLLLVVHLQQDGPTGSNPFFGLLASSWALAKCWCTENSCFVGNLGDLNSYGVFLGYRFAVLVLEKKMPLLLDISVSELLGWQGGFVWLVVFEHTIGIFCL